MLWGNVRIFTVGKEKHSLPEILYHFLQADFTSCLLSTVCIIWYLMFGSRELN